MIREVSTTTLEIIVKNFNPLKCEALFKIDASHTHLYTLTSIYGHDNCNLIYFECKIAAERMMLLWEAGKLTYIFNVDIETVRGYESVCTKATEKMQLIYFCVQLETVWII